MTLEAWREPAARFVQTFLEHKPDYIHRLVVVCNGEPAKPVTKQLFAPLLEVGTTPEFSSHDNSGHDIGAYQFASRTFSKDCDLMVFLGATTYFRREGWLKRIAESYEKHGNGLYGAMAHRGTPGVHAHIRTTGFWMTPELFNSYPHRVRHVNQRYGFEHGPECLTAWTVREGLVPLVVSWIGEHPHSEWDSHEGYHCNDQKNLLLGDRMSREPYHYCS